MGFVYVLQMLDRDLDAGEMSAARGSGGSGADVRLGAIGASPMCSAAGERPCRS